MFSGPRYKRRARVLPDGFIYTIEDVNGGKERVKKPSKKKPSKRSSNSLFKFGTTKHFVRSDKSPHIGAPMSVLDAAGIDIDIDKPYFKQPAGKRWIQYDRQRGIFRHRRNSSPLDGTTVRALLRKGHKVWVVGKTKRTPVAVSKATKPRSEGDTIRRKSSFDKVSVTFKPYYNKPRGNRWIFWVVNLKDFREPHHGLGSGLLRGESAKYLVNAGYKVYVVKEVPAPWD